MSALKQIAARHNMAAVKKETQFYRSFMQSVRWHGRVRETEFMTLYFAGMKNPLLPLQYAPLGMRLMLKRKIGVQIPWKGKRALDAIFRKAEELEVTR